MNSVRLDYEDPAIAAALKDCKAGEPKTLTITINPTEVGDGFIEGDLEAVRYKKPKEKMDESSSERPPVPKRSKAKPVVDEEDDDEEESMGY